MLRFEFDHLPGWDSMLVFHALAHLGVESLIIVSPKDPIISIGYFQDAEKEIDLEYCKQAGLPYMRREIGGGATYLDNNQIFYQVVMNRDNPLTQGGVQEIYERLSQAPIETYGNYGIKTSFRRVNDIVTDKGKKIAGEGGADIGQSMVFVGGILMDFDYDTMCKALKVPDEKFRDKLFKTMRDNVTTMKEELGELPPRQDVRNVLIESFEKIVGRTQPASLNDEIRRTMAKLSEKYGSDTFLHKKTPKVPAGVKIRDGVELQYGIHKARGGLIRTVQEIEDNVLKNVTISGDFTFMPKDRLESLESHLSETARDAGAVRDRVEEFYEKNPVDSPGVESEDYVKAMNLEDA